MPNTLISILLDKVMRTVKKVNKALLLFNFVPDIYYLDDAVKNTDSIEIKP
jgi:hypothetical protein